MDVLKKLFIITLILSSCSSGSETSADEETKDLHQVVVTNAPLYDFTVRLAPSDVKVRFPMAEASDPAYWEISADSIAMMQQADLIIMNGADYETWAAKVSLPVSKIVYSIEKEDQLIPVENAVTHSHGDEGEHAHQGTAFTTWMDFNLAAAQVRKIADALKSEFPEYASETDQRLSDLTADLNTLNQAMTEAADTSGYYVFSHPVYQYFQRAYRVKGESVHWEPDEILGKEELHDLEHISDHHPITAVVWEDTPSDTNLQKLDSMGIKSIVVRPAGGWESGYDFLEIMKTNIQNLREMKKEQNDL